MIPEEYEFSISKNKPEIIELNEGECSNNIIFKDGKLIKRSKSFKIPDKNQLEEINKIKEIKLYRNAGNMKIEGEYYNG